MFIQSAVYWTLAVTGDLIAGSHQPSSCLYDCVGVWRLQFHSDPPPARHNFYCNQPLCVYVVVNVCVANLDLQDVCLYFHWSVADVL